MSPSAQFEKNIPTLKIVLHRTNLPSETLKLRKPAKNKCNRSVGQDQCMPYLFYINQSINIWKLFIYIVFTDIAGFLTFGVWAEGLVQHSSIFSFSAFSFSAERSKH